MIRPGKMRDKVSLLHVLQASSGDFGETGAETTEATYAKAWAEIEQINGKEAIAYRGKVTSVFWKFRLRYRTDILPTDRIVAKGRTFEILGMVDDENRNRDLLIDAVEVG